MCGSVLFVPDACPLYLVVYVHTYVRMYVHMSVCTSTYVGDHTKIHLNTRNMFIEITATDQTKVRMYVHVYMDTYMCVNILSVGLSLHMYVHVCAIVHVCACVRAYVYAMCTFMYVSHDVCTSMYMSVPCYTYVLVCCVVHGAAVWVS